MPFGEIPSTTITVLRERGISADGQSSKPLCSEDMSAADIVINMTGRSSGSIFTEPVPQVEDWDVGDPYGFDLAKAFLSPAEFRVILCCLKPSVELQ